MIRISALALAAALAAAPCAFAQTTKTPDTPATTPPATTVTPSPSTGTQLNFYNHQADEMRASKLIGTTVRNDANENVGEINELILDKDGKVVAVVVGVGGFLGIGEREVALDYKSLRFEQDTSATARAGTKVAKLNVTKDALKNAPAWTWERNGTATSPPAQRTR